MKKYTQGFTLIELTVVVAIIGMLSAVLYANFDDARKQARDKARMTSLKELQLAIELYKAQNGSYPTAGCSAGTDKFAGPGSENRTDLVSCTGTAQYISQLGFIPDFISALPIDPKSETVSNQGIYYRSDGTSYKLMFLDTVETATVTSYGDEFARCPAVTGSGEGCPSSTPPAATYAVYSVGAETW